MIIRETSPIYTEGTLLSDVLTIEDEDERSRVMYTCASKVTTQLNNFLISIYHESGNRGERKKGNEYESHWNGKKDT